MIIPPVGIISAVAHDRQPIEASGIQFRTSMFGNISIPSTFVFPITNDIAGIISIQPKSKAVKKGRGDILHTGICINRKTKGVGTVIRIKLQETGINDSSRHV